MGIRVGGADVTTKKEREEREKSSSYTFRGRCGLKEHQECVFGSKKKIPVIRNKGGRRGKSGGHEWEVEEKPGGFQCLLRKRTSEDKKINTGRPHAELSETSNNQHNGGRDSHNGKGDAYRLGVNKNERKKTQTPERERRTLYIAEERKRHPILSGT